MKWTLGVMIVASSTVLAQSNPVYLKPDRPDRPDRPNREAMVLGFIHQANQNEIALAKLALQNSNSDQVKAFANRMINEHTQADNQVVAFADSHNISLPSAAEIKAVRERQADRQELANRSKEIGSETGEYAFYNVGTGGSGFQVQATIDKLSSLKGPDFDREYAQAVVKDHQLVVDGLTNARAKITDPDEMKLIDQLLPTVKQHLSSARQLNDSVNS